MADKQKKELSFLQLENKQQIRTITGLFNLSTDLNKSELHEFFVRYDKLEKDYTTFEQNRAEIFRLLINLGMNDEIEEEEKTAIEVQKMYYHILAAHRTISFTEGEPSLTVTSSLSNSHHPQVRLPKIELPVFEGNLKEWPHFKDLFVSLIHGNESLSESEKLHYLVSCLKSEPLFIVKTLPLASENYKIIWNQLIERYDNKRQLATCYFEEVLNVSNLSTESSKGLRQLINLCSENLTALCAMNFPIDCSDFILGHLVLQKLDKHTRQLFERSHAKFEFPTLEQILSFLKEHCKSLEAASSPDKDPAPATQYVSKPKFSSYNNQPYNTRSYGKPQPLPRQAYVASSQQISNQQCLYCNGNHAIYRCQPFTALPVFDRKTFIKSKQACFNCLSHGHSYHSCSSSSLCKKCFKPHHTMLHDSPLPGNGSPSFKPVLKSQPTLEQHHSSPASSSTQPALPVITSHVSSKLTTTILGTAAIQIQDASGCFKTVRALLDPGSQVSFITEECISKLSLPRKRFITPVMGISQSIVQTSQGIVKCSIKPRSQNQPCLQVNAVVLKCITAPLPSAPLPFEVKQSYKNLDLADPFFDVPGKIDFLIGADLFPEVVDGGRKRTKPGYPTPYRSIFGWILIGNTIVQSKKPDPLTTHLTVAEVTSLDSMLKRFWEIEESPSKVHVSLEDQRAEKMFAQSVSRDSTGRYIVKLPFRDDPPDLGQSYSTSLQSFNNLECRLKRNPELKLQYDQFLNEYLSLGHMKPVSLKQAHPKYFIPHHGVFKTSQDEKTSQLRVVFNASAKTTNSQSLNDQLLVGPKLQNNICDIISNFRLYPFVFTADICKMYRQILIHPDHQKYQAILWRESPQKPVSCYLLNTVTYGVSSAPYLAIRTLHQLVQDEGQAFPLAAQSILKDIYVDDILVSLPTLEDAMLLKSELVSLLKLGGFELKKWASNCAKILEDDLESSAEISLSKHVSNSDSIKVLGVKWHPQMDCFLYQVKVEKHSITKRTILSIVSSIFDPLGWVTPTILWAKKLIQILWTSGVNWDDTTSNEITNAWSRFVSELPQLEQLKIPRLVLPGGNVNVQLHGFCDASSEGYGACLYLRSESDQGVTVKLILAKSKVAPLKSLSIPRLELCATVTLSRLVQFYTASIREKLGNVPVFAWTDSTIALNWIHTSPHLLKTFIANRVSEVQDIIQPNSWFHVPTADNPADCASRGLLPSQLLDHQIWWNGPTWLSEDPSNWPSLDYPRICTNEIPEAKSTTIVSAVVTEFVPDEDYLERFSSLTRVKRIFGWCLRFKTNCQKTPGTRFKGPLSTAELNNALVMFVRLTQKQYFGTEIAQIKAESPLKTDLQRLDLFIDCDGIVRVGGRLRHSSIQFDSRHPILLPKNCNLTTLIIDHYHKSYFHSGPRTLQSLIQRQFWIISLRNVIRKEIWKCVKCTRMKAKSIQPFMADLPAFRVNACRPFLKIGVDYGGPFSIKTERSRKPQIRKAYLCIFICLSTKALHLELVSDLSTDTFLAALNRLIARRGLCTDIYSDQGTNFIGAKNDLSDLYRFLNSPNNSQLISSKLANKGITWHLNPPAAPHFGGIWEAGIKSAKYHLYRVIGDQILTFEELTTFFIQVEAILNSRPLCPLSTDTTEIDVLTPGHFLIGQPLVSIPQHELSTLPQNRLSRWQLLEKARQHFWKRWSTEYLNTLQQRNKWTSRIPNLKFGDMVIVKEANLSPLTWRLGRVVETFPGHDGITRVVKIQTSDGILIRPIVKLCPLPVN